MYVEERMYTLRAGTAQPDPRRHALEALGHRRREPLERDRLDEDRQRADPVPRRAVAISAHDRVGTLAGGDREILEPR